MLKIFLTADNHIGLKYAGHEQSALLVEARIEAFERMVSTANEQGCDLFVIAGDLFENTYSIPKRDVSRVMDMLSAFHGTVAILPGNHDYYDKDVKLWQYIHAAAAEKDNLLLLTDYRPYSLSIDEKEVILYPALCTSLHSASGENNLGWIASEDMSEKGIYRLGIAHGAVEGETIDSEGRYFLMTRAQLESIPVDAWLIGHTHVPFPRTLSECCTVTDERIFNAGTHVQTDVACRTEGLCFLLEIDEDKTVRAGQFVSGNLRFVRLFVTLTAGEMEETLARTLSPLADRTVVDLVLSGAVTEEEYRERTAIIERQLARFTEGTYSDHALSRLISKELIEAEFPETSFSAGFLSALLSNPKEAQLAYELLQTLKEGK